MSVLEKYKKLNKTKGVFVIVKGVRLAGKSTLAGTMPGKSVLVQAGLLETGSSSAESLAKKLKNDLAVLEFNKLEELTEILESLATSDIKNIYIDGISAITELKHREPKTQRKLINGGNGVWDAFRDIAEASEQMIELCKKITETTDKNVFMTLSLDPKFDPDGNVVELIPSTKGNATLGKIERYGNNAVVVKILANADKTLKRVLVTRTDGPYTARIDSLLDDNNPGVIDADIAKLIKLIKGE